MNGDDARTWGWGAARAGRLRRAVGAAALAAVACTPGAGRAQSSKDLLLHGTAISYLDSQVKDAGWVAGVYGTWGSGWRHLVEVGASRTAVDYLDGWQLRQTDATLAYGRYGAVGAGRVGAHLVSSTDPLTDGGVVVFAGASHYRPGRWSVGVEAVRSSYPDHGSGLTVAQVAPSLGITRSDALGSRIFGATLRGYWIRPSEDLGLGSRSFYSGEASLSFTAGRLTVSGYGWAGEQAFAVRGGGFTVFNLAELHSGGFGGGARWVLSPRSAASVGYYRERFEDMGTTNRAWTRSISVSLGLTL